MCSMPSLTCPFILLEKTHSYSLYAISASVVDASFVTVSPASSTGTCMACTKQTPRKPHDDKDGDKDKVIKDLTCFVCGHKFTLKM